MNGSASQRLIDRVRKVVPKSLGIGDAEISCVPLTKEVIADIKECLSSSEAYELKWGLTFAHGFLGSNPPEEFLNWLFIRIPEWLKHENWDVRNCSLDLFVRFRKTYENYREVMLGMLNDPEPTIRWEVLRHHKTFLQKEDIPALLRFQNDEYMSETEMNSPLIYAIRNHALTIIEDLCGKQFRKSEKVEPGPNGLLVYWWDWAPFLEWWEAQNRGWKFWKKRLL